MKLKENLYGTDHIGTIIYITSAVTNPSAITANVNASGYYYFDGNAWQKLIKQDTHIYSSNGALNDDRTVNLNNKTLSFQGTSQNAFMRIQNDGKVGIGSSSPTEALDINGSLRIRKLDEINSTTDKVITSNTEGVLKKVDPKTFFNTIDQTINFRGLTANATATGDEDVIWFGSNTEGTLTLNLPTDAQVRRGRVIHIIASGANVKFEGVLPTIYNGTYTDTLEYKSRISIVPVNVFGGKGWYVISASKIYD